MKTRLLFRAIACLTVDLALHLLEAVACLAAIGLLTALLGLLLPLPAALLISILAVCIAFGSLMAHRIERARTRGEWR